MNTFPLFFLLSGYKQDNDVSLIMNRKSYIKTMLDSKVMTSMEYFYAIQKQVYKCQLLILKC